MERPLFYFFILLASLLLISPAFAESEQKIVIGFDRYEAPYVLEEDDSGVTVEIVREALALEGYSVTPEYFSPIYTDKAIETRVDGIAHSYMEEAQEYYLSQPYLTRHNCIVTKSGSGIDLDSLNDLTGHRVVAWPGARHYLGDEYAALFNAKDTEEHSPDYLEHSKQLAKMKMFLLDRADVLVTRKETYEWYQKTLSDTDHIDDPVTFHYLLPKVTPVRAAFRDPELRDAFDRGIEKLKQSGRYHAIQAHYFGESGVSFAASENDSTDMPEAAIELVPASVSPQ